MEFLKTAWDKVIAIGAGIGGFIAGLYGGWDVSMWVLVGIMAIDYASGLVVAAMGKSGKSESGGLDSNVGWKGLARKFLTLLLVLVAAMVDRVLGDGAAFRTMACWFYIANEALSILENTALAGVHWPEGLKKALEQMKAKSEEIE